MRVMLPAAGLAFLIAALPVSAQITTGSVGQGVRGDTYAGMKLLIRRRTVSGTVKQSDTERKHLVLASTSGKPGTEVHVDVGPALIRAGKGQAKFDDLKVGDKLRIFGEVTIQGGLRAMEITAPKERMTIPPPVKPPKVKVPKEPKPKKGTDKKVDEKKPAVSPAS